MAYPFHKYKTMAISSNNPMPIDQIIFKHVIQSLVAMCNKLFKENISHVVVFCHV